MRGTGGGCARARRAFLAGALLAFGTTDGRGGTHCPDPAQVNVFGAPGAELRAANDAVSWAPASSFATPISEVVDSITPFGGVFHAEMDAAPATSFGYPIVITFALDGEQGVSINGAHSRLDWPLELDLAGLPAGQPLLLDYDLEVTSAIDEGAGSRHATLTLTSLSGGSPQTIGPLTGSGAQADGLFAGAARPSGADFRLRLQADAFVAAPSGRQGISGTLRVLLRTAGDFDGDGLADLTEVLGTDGLPGSGDESDPGRFDADLDGENDARELARGGDPFDACDVDPAGAEANCLELGEDMSWRAITGCGAQAVTYNLYRGRLDVLRAGGPYTQPNETTGGSFCGLTGLSQADGTDPAVGEILYWLVTAARDGVDVTLGFDSDGQVRPNDNPCP